MSNVIRFLEAIGSKPMSAAEYTESVAALEVDDFQKAALLNRDFVALNDTLGGRSKVFFGILAPVEDEAGLEELAA